MRQRALSSGAGLIVGRSKDPEAVVQLAGTVMRMEASGEAHSGELRSGRAQHTYVIPPQVVREAWDGRFWLIHRGAIAPFRVLPPAPAGNQVAAEDQAQRPADAPAPAGTIDAAPAVVDEVHDAEPEAAAVEALAEAGETSTPGDPYAGLVYEPSDDDAPPVDEAPPVDVDEPAAQPEREPEPAAAVPAPRPAPRGFSATRRPTTKQGG